jgi:hypothetical protein
MVSQGGQEENRVRGLLLESANIDVEARIAAATKTRSRILPSRRMRIRRIESR